MLLLYVDHHASREHCQLPGWTVFPFATQALGLLLFMSLSEAVNMLGCAGPLKCLHLSRQSLFSLSRFNSAALTAACCSLDKEAILAPSGKHCPISQVSFNRLNPWHPFSSGVVCIWLIWSIIRHCWIATEVRWGISPSDEGIFGQPLSIVADIQLGLQKVSHNNSAEWLIFWGTRSSSLSLWHSSGHLSMSLPSICLHQEKGKRERKGIEV